MRREISATITELWQHRKLIWQFTKRNVEIKHRGSHLGLAWSLLGPLLLLGLYVMVFGFIFDGRLKPDSTVESRVEYALAIFLGLAIHHFVAEVLTTSPALVLGNPNFVKKVVFPLSVLPAAGVGAALVHFLITLGLVFAGAVLTGAPVTWSTLPWLPVILLPLIMTALGGALIISSFSVFWRDLAQITQFLSLALLFASGVFYSVADIPAGAWAWLRFNPLIHFINEARNVVFWSRAPSAAHLVYLYACGAGALLAGGIIFRRLRSRFADEV